MSLNHLDVNPTAAPCVMVIFGATGDLTKRKLLRSAQTICHRGLCRERL